MQMPTPNGGNNLSPMGNNYRPQQQNPNHSMMSNSSGYSPSPSPHMPQPQRMQQQPPQNYRPGPGGPSNVKFTTTTTTTTTTTQKKNNKRTQISVELFKGNYVVNCPVAKNVIKNGKFDGSLEEFGYCRYTAATCKDPDNFRAENFTLRQDIWKRKTELFIVLTMYNEDEVLFARSMTSVMKNIGYMCRENKKKWSRNGWQNIVVCIVSDGRKKINAKVLDCLEVMGVYQKDVMKNQVNGKDVSAHIFEYTVQTCFDEKMNLNGPEKGYTPVQVLFCLKENNKKKINSHRWFFNAFGTILNPEVCVLIDVGTKPTHDSIYQLWKTFDRNPNVGGACGEIYAQLGSKCKNLLNPLIATQNFEYKISNILDKPLESVFGYISVLPGAFSAYRYRALQNYDVPEGQRGPLYSYFKGEKLHEGSNMFKSNMYLAEDRILCFELVAKKNCKWLLKYVKAAKAETDVPDNVPEFISQRRRWLNGSFFAAVYSMYNWSKIWETNHSAGRKFALCFEFVYNLINIAFSWFNLANFYLCFKLLSDSVSEDKNSVFGEYGVPILATLRQLYIYALVIIFVCSLGNRPQGSKKLYILCIFLFVIVMGFMLYLSGYTVYKSFTETDESFVTKMGNPTFRNIVVSLLSTYGLYLLGSIIHGQPWHMITSFVQYMFMLPSFVNILMVYAFCNTHDVSWGTKGDNAIAPTESTVKIQPGEKISIELPTQSSLDERYEKLVTDIKRREKVVTKSKRDETTKQDDDKKNFRTNLVLIWILCNILLVTLMTSVLQSDAFKKFCRESEFLKSLGINLDTDYSHNHPFLAFIFWSVAILSAVRFIGSAYYLVDNIINK